MKKLLTGALLITGLATSTICSAEIGLYRIKMIDSLTLPSQKYVTLDGYTNPACDNNRILVQFSDPEQQKQVFVMLLGAFLGGYYVDFSIAVTPGQCYATRVFVHR
jgi:hypothetical protein